MWRWKLQRWKEEGKKTQKRIETLIERKLRHDINLLWKDLLRKKIGEPFSPIIIHNSR
jgi:hypothetical protein